MDWFWGWLEALNRFGENYEHALVSFGTIALAFFTLTLWLSTMALWWVTRSTLKIARQEFIATHRPQVTIRTIVPPTTDEKGLWNAEIVVVNTGDTPATITKFGADIAWKTLSGWIPGLESSPKPISAVKLESGERHTFKASSKMNPDQVQNEFSHIGPIWCVGELSYIDENGLQRATGFDRLWQPNLQQFVPSEFGGEFAD